jgi:hypothetical protein
MISASINAPKRQAQPCFMPKRNNSYAVAANAPRAAAQYPNRYSAALVSFVPRLGGIALH